MEYHTTLALPVPAAEAWDVLASLPSWPRWASTVESIEAETPRPQIGSTVAIKQPGRALAHYRIDVVEDGRRFRWRSDRGGVRQLADHVVEPTGEDSCTVTLTFTMAGPLGAVLGALGARKIRDMVDAEAAGLRKILVDKPLDKAE